MAMSAILEQVFQYVEKEPEEKQNRLAFTFLRLARPDLCDLSDEEILDELGWEKRFREHPEVIEKLIEEDKRDSSSISLEEFFAE